jgi:tetratricopeptide (TPR) repeat protein
MHPHSLELRVLSQTGLVGATLFLGFLAAALVGAARLLRRADRYSGALAAACLGAFAYWLFHGSVDWLWEFPALGAPAMAWLALAARVGEDEQAEPARPLPMAAVLPIALVAAAVAANIAFPWISAKTAASAAATWPADPSGAFHKLDLARRLNPLSDEPDLIAGVIASRIHDVRRERTAFERVLDRNPYNWYARFELAIIDANEGKRAAALAALRGARRLDPREPLIPYVRGKIEHRRPVSQAQIDALLRERTAILTGAHQR